MKTPGWSPSDPLVGEGGGGESPAIGLGSLRAPSTARVYNKYVLVILTLVYLLNFLDRGLIGLLLEPIKIDLHLSDTQLGFVTGIAFGLFYATLGLPIARWADSGNRVTITSIAIGLWGVAVMSCLFVTSFAQLAAARVAAAVGEAGCTPPTYSLVGDYFPKPAERARSMAVYLLGAPLAWLVSFAAGGWLNAHYGWRMTFFLMGIPGLIVAAIVIATIREPRATINKAVPRKPLPTKKEVLGALVNQGSLRNLVAGIILTFTAQIGLIPWYAAFMVRSHGATVQELGLWLGPIFGISGTLGLIGGAYVVDRWLSTDEARQLRWIAMVTALLLPCFVIFLLLPNKHAALLALIPIVAGANCVLGPAFTLMQRLVVDEMRATTLSVVMLFANLIGMGIGSQGVGVLSDMLAPVAGLDSLRYAMLVASLLTAWSAWHFLRSGRTVKADLAQVTRPLRPDDLAS